MSKIQQIEMILVSIHYSESNEETPETTTTELYFQLNCQHQIVLIIQIQEVSRISLLQNQSQHFYFFDFEDIKLQNQDRFNPNGKASNNDDLVIKNSNNETSETSPVENMLHRVDDEQNTANRDDFGEYLLLRIQ